MKATAITKLIVASLFAAPFASAARIGFGQPGTGERSTVLVGEAVFLPSLIAFSNTETEGLFSYGVALLYEGPNSENVSFRSVAPVPSLDYDGVNGSGAFIRTAATFAGAKGTVDLGVTPLPTFRGPLLATFELSFSAPGEYFFRGDFFNTLGPTEAIFVDGSGIVLDPNIEFGTYTYTVVVPEPVAGIYLILSASLLALRRRRGCCLA